MTMRYMRRRSGMSRLLQPGHRLEQMTANKRSNSTCMRGAETLDHPSPPLVCAVSRGRYDLYTPDVRPLDPATTR